MNLADGSVCYTEDAFHCCTKDSKMLLLSASKCDLRYKLERPISVCGGTVCREATSSLHPGGVQRGLNHLSFSLRDVVVCKEALATSPLHSGGVQGGLSRLSFALPWCARRP